MVKKDRGIFQNPRIKGASRKRGNEIAIMGDAKDVECSVQGMLMTLFVLADPMLQWRFSEKEINVFPVSYHLRTSVRAHSMQHILESLACFA